MAIKLALDPMTDWYTQFANLVAAAFPSMTLQVETPDEPWNCAGAGASIGDYATSKSAAYIAADPTHWSAELYCVGGPGNVPNWQGKIASTLGQALAASNLTHYELIDGVQTGYTTGIQFNPWNPILTSAMYLAQDTSLIPVQSGYTQTAGLMGCRQVTRLASNSIRGIRY